VDDVVQDPGMYREDPLYRPPVTLLPIGLDQSDNPIVLHLSCDGHPESSAPFVAYSIGSKLSNIGRHIATILNSE
jgi:hypothetical protein